VNKLKEKSEKVRQQRETNSCRSFWPQRRS